MHLQDLSGSARQLFGDRAYWLNGCLCIGLLEHVVEALLDLVNLGQQDGDRLWHQLPRVVLADRLDLVYRVLVLSDVRYACARSAYR